jgi:hypothetical protein
MPSLKSKLSDIVTIEPYSFDNQYLQHLYGSSELYTAVLDFLQEYADGHEEMSDTDLVELAKMLGKNINILQPEEFDNSADQDMISANKFIVKVDGNVVNYGGTVDTGYHDIEVTYTGQSSVIKVVHDSNLVGAQGNTILLQNVYITVHQLELDLRAYGERLVMLDRLIFKAEPEVIA